ncbi:hypothetical protein ONZ45_g13093 [Pleurotus djamor]|nr:hypothetical protein ONZ45_g13093 [Pleurotus djamor]
MYRARVGRVLSAVNPQGQSGHNTHLIKRGQNSRTLKTKRRRVAEDKPEAEPIIPEWSPNDELEGWEIEDHADLDDEDVGLLPAGLRKRYASSDNPMQEWMAARESFLHEMLKHEAQTPDGRAGVCSTCSVATSDSEGTDTREGIEGTDAAREGQPEPLFRCREKPDPGLHTGLAYFVPQKPYNDHILKHVSESDMKNCSSFNAISRADSKSTSGLRYTGVGMCVCSRHEMVRPLGIGDLQKGERYCNMDFIFLSAILSVALARVMVIYDIACQWKVNLPTRIPQLPQELQPSPDCKLDFAIPKCHTPAHQASCQAPHSLNLKPGAGRTDGEGIERDWSVLNPAANSTRAMGPGSRHDTLDDLIAYHNWQKTTALGHSLKRKYYLAVVESRKTKDLHDDFCNAIPIHVRQAWMKMVVAWEEDPKKPNPYEVPVNQNDIKKKLLDIECRDSALGRINHDKTETAFLSAGLMIEESQRRLRLESTSSLTSIQTSQQHERRLLITKQIKALRKAQEIHIPMLDTLLDQSPLVDAEHVKLWLPSALTAAERSSCAPSLSAKEAELRIAQCNDALERIRLNQRAKRQVAIHKQASAPGQQTGIRVQAEFDRIGLKIEQASQKYRTARLALVSLVGEAHVPAGLRILREGDVCPPPVFDIDTVAPVRNIQQAASRLNEGYREVPWIWRVAGGQVADDVGELNAGLRVEWAKSRARYLRWKEEVLLVKEEMRRVRVSLEYEANKWSERQTASSTITTDPTLAQGLSAYAHRQVLVRKQLHASFTTIWEQPPGKRSKLALSIGVNDVTMAVLDDSAQRSELVAAVGRDRVEEAEEEEEEGVLSEDEDDEGDDEENNEENDEECDEFDTDEE